MTSGKGGWGTEGQLREGILIKENFQQHVSTKKKKWIKWELSFIWGKNEGYNLWGSIADSSEKLLQRSGGRGQCQGRGILEVEPRFWQKIAASHREQMSPLMILVLF